jgi:NhaP-type Na+/H+ or K+/H+ antiporter
MPLGCLLALMARQQSRVIFTILGVILPALMIEGIFAVKTSRDLSFSNALLGIVFTLAVMMIYRFIFVVPSSKS